jgi:ferric-dicitrate binding protein FerR (iron transport regulator)
MSINKEKLEGDFEKYLSDSLNVNRIPYRLSKAEAWNNIQSAIADSKIVPIRKTIPVIRWAAAAAVLFAIALTSIFAGRQTVISEEASFAMVRLPDGSSVTVGAGSEIQYNSVSWLWNRKVSLSGRAFFDVEKGSTFTVNTSEGDIAVLGTSFDVDVDSGRLEVACKTGKVGISKGGKLLDVITPGEKLVVNQNGIVKSNIDMALIDLWFKTDFTFENVSLRQAIEVVATHFNHEVIVPEYVQLQYTGKLSKKLTLEESLDIICRPFGLSYSIDDSKNLITITKN